MCDRKLKDLADHKELFYDARDKSKDEAKLYLEMAAAKKLTARWRKIALAVILLMVASNSSVMAFARNTFHTIQNIVAPLDNAPMFTVGDEAVHISGEPFRDEENESTICHYRSGDLYITIIEESRLAGNEENSSDRLFDFHEAKTADGYTVYYYETNDNEFFGRFAPEGRVQRVNVLMSGGDAQDFIRICSSIVKNEGKQENVH